MLTDDTIKEYANLFAGSAEIHPTWSTLGQRPSAWRECERICRELLAWRAYGRDAAPGARERLDTALLVLYGPEDSDKLPQTERGHGNGRDG